jgi:hypothetical protein
MFTSLLPLSPRAPDATEFPISSSSPVRAQVGRFCYASPLVLTLVALLGCVSTTPKDAKFEAERAALERAGVPSLAFESEGQLINLTYSSWPQSAHFKLIEERLYFRNEPIDFLWSSAEEYRFYNRSLDSQIEFSLNKSKGVIELAEMGGLFFRTWQSMASAEQFVRWTHRFIDLGYSQSKVGFVPEVKFVDGTQTALRTDERRVFFIEYSGDSVTLDNEPVSLAVVTMENGSQAVELRKQGEIFWLFGGGNFQVNVEGLVKTTYVGSSAPPTGSTMPGTVPQLYVELYPKLKMMAQSR